MVLVTAPRVRPSAGRGRPRKQAPSRPDASPVEEILEAAAALFIERGFAATTTRAITDRVGVRQGALYYHFPSKDDVLAELLRRIIAYPLRIAEALANTHDVPAAVRLATLVRCDAHELLAAEHNIGSLFLLPETRQERFDAFRMDRQRLRGYYRQMIADAIAEDDLPTLPTQSGEFAQQMTTILADAVFGLVESVISIREDRQVEDRELIETAIQASALRIIGQSDHQLRTTLNRATVIRTPDFEAATSTGMKDR